MRVFGIHGGIGRVVFLYIGMEFVGEFPDTKFLIFTKRYGWANQWLRKHTRPENATILFSAWPGYKMDNPNKLPVAWIRDGESKRRGLVRVGVDNRIPKDAIECPGGCEHCGMLELAEIGSRCGFRQTLIPLMGGKMDKEKLVQRLMGRKQSLEAKKLEIEAHQASQTKTDAILCLRSRLEELELVFLYIEETR